MLVTSCCLFVVCWFAIGWLLVVGLVIGFVLLIVLVRSILGFVWFLGLFVCLVCLFVFCCFEVRCFCFCLLVYLVLLFACCGFCLCDYVVL